jgi:hypothetical protein
VSGALHSGNLVGHFYYPIFTHGLKDIRPERNEDSFGVVFAIGTCQQIITICVGQFEDAEESKGGARRALMNPFFSMVSVRKLPPIIEERVQTFLGRLNQWKSTSEVIRMPVVVNAFSNGQFS